MKNSEFKNWHILLGIETLFGGSVIAVLVSQIGVLQPSYTLGIIDVEAIFLMMLISFILGFWMGKYHEKGE